MMIRTLLCIGLMSLAASAREPVDYVDPNIGGIGYLLQPALPNVQLPYGMVRLAPVTTPGVKDRYLADKVYGFPAGASLIMAANGPLETDPPLFASLYDHDLETVTPYSYRATLESYNIEAEYTVTRRAAVYRFTFPENVSSRILLAMRNNGEVTVPSPTVVAGYEDPPLGLRTYFYAEFSSPYSACATWKGPLAAQGSSKQTGSNIGAALEFASARGKQVLVRIGVSYIGTDQARENLVREIPNWDFEAVKAEARATWNRALSRIQVKGGDEQQRTIFYTSLYRAMGRPNNITEDGRYFSGADKQVHATEGHDFYVSRGLWGSYRSLHPLQLLLDPQRIVDTVRSYIRMYEQWGWMLAYGRPGMIGHHIAALTVDAYMKGHRGFEAEKAYQGLKKNAMEATMIPWRRGPATSLDRHYFEHGFFPALAKGEKESVPEVDSFERRQSVGVTLEAAYDDWCLAEFARALNKPEDYAYFSQRARNYEKVFDTRIGFMRPKTADGKWVEPFDPTWSGGQGGRDYFTEMNSWIYTFHVQQDVPGLIRLMGGREKFVAKLDALFREQYRGYQEGAKFVFLRQFPDQTGLIGQYAHGNEPSFHIPYLYNYAGEPWKTQRKVREIMKVWYQAHPLGYSGDEDDGEESSWYVFSAMGFYPVCPGRPTYDIGSPIFEEVRISLENGRAFTITARNVSGANKYIQSATLNGVPLTRPQFEHADVTNGGALVLEMGPRPNTGWGSAPNRQ